jgi:prephenate dehydrogenase
MISDAAMTTQITILGLDLIGQSLGLALSARDFPVTGFDPLLETAQAAQKLGAVRQTKWNMAHAVAEADLTLVCLPLAEQREALDAVAQDFRPGSTVVGVSPLLAVSLAWAAEVLPPDRYFIALHPLTSPARPYEKTPKVTPSADLFKQGQWAMAPSATCAPEALQLVNGLANVTGASPYFVDPAEHDGLMAGASALPILLAGALMGTAAASPGWTEMRKVADHGFATATAALDNDQAFAALSPNRQNVLRYLDATLNELRALREKLAADDQAALAAALTEAAMRRAAWLADCARGDWDAPEKPAPALPTAGEALKRFLVGGLFERRGKK